MPRASPVRSLARRRRAATPLDDLIKPEVDASACFTRVYDAAHLRAHPRQKTTAMTVWLKYEPRPAARPAIGLGVSLAITQRGDPAALFSQGGCDFGRPANRDTSNNRLIKTYPKEAGSSACNRRGRTCSRRSARRRAAR